MKRLDSNISASMKRSDSSSVHGATSVGGKRRCVLTRVNLSRRKHSTQPAISECFDWVSRRYQLGQVREGRVISCCRNPISLLSRNRSERLLCDQLETTLFETDFCSLRIIT